MAPTLFTACNALPPEGAAAPADWQSQIRGPCLKRQPPRSFAVCNSLPEGAIACDRSWPGNVSV
jgi:hypothetical protein